MKNIFTEIKSIWDVTNGEQAEIFAKNTDNYEIISLLFLGWTESLDFEQPDEIEQERLIGFLKGLSGWTLEEIETNMYTMMYFYTVSTQGKDINDYVQKDKLNTNILSDFKWDTLRKSCELTFNCSLCTKSNSPYCTTKNFTESDG